MSAIAGRVAVFVLPSTARLQEGTRSEGVGKSGKALLVPDTYIRALVEKE